MRDALPGADGRALSTVPASHDNATLPAGATQAPAGDAGAKPDGAPQAPAGSRVVVVIGVGNALRGDDTAGLDVAARLRGEPGMVVHAHAGEGIDLISMWEGADAVVLIDTVRSGAAAGTLHRFDVSAVAPPSPLRRQAGHAINLATAIELARTIGRLPPTVIIYGVEGEQFETGSAPSAAVAAALAPLTDAVRAQASALLRR